MLHRAYIGLVFACALPSLNPMHIHIRTYIYIYVYICLPPPPRSTFKVFFRQIKKKALIPRFLIFGRIFLYMNSFSHLIRN